MKSVKLLVLVTLIKHVATTQTMEVPDQLSLQAQETVAIRPLRRIVLPPPAPPAEQSTIDALISSLCNKDEDGFNALWEVLDVGQLDAKTLTYLLALARDTQQSHIIALIQDEQEDCERKILAGLLNNALEIGDLISIQQIVNQKGINYDYGPAYSPDETKTILDMASERHQSTLVRWLVDQGAHVNTGGEYSPLQCAFMYQDYELAEYLLQQGAIRSISEPVNIGDMRELELLLEYGLLSRDTLYFTIASINREDEQTLHNICWFLMHGLYPLHRPISPVINKLLTDLNKESPISAVLAQLPSGITRNSPYALRLKAINVQIEGAFYDISTENINDLNNALVIAAGQGTLLKTSLVQRPGLFRQASILQALYASGLNGQTKVFEALVNFFAVPNEKLKEIIQRLLRPCILKGDTACVGTLLTTALTRHIVLDILPIGKLLDKRLTSYSATKEHSSYRAAHLCSNYKAIRHILADYIRKIHLVRTLERLQEAPEQETIINEHLPRDLRRRSEQAPGLRFYILPQIKGYFPQLPPELIYYIITFLLARLAPYQQRK